MTLQQPLQFLQTKAMEVFRLAERRFKGFGRQLGGDVEERSGKGGDRNFAPDGQLYGRIADLVSAKRRGRSCRAGGRDVDLTAIPNPADAPELCGRTVAEDGPLPYAEDSGKPASFLADDAVADRKDAWMKQVQSSSTDSPVDRAPTHPDPHELRP
jgi:hypothetical protein